MSLDRILTLKGTDVEIHPMAKLVPEYKMIIMKSEPVKGDNDGRKKIQAKKEFLYIYHLIDPRSICSNLPYSQRREKARITAGLDEDWKESQFVTAAVLRYKEDILLSATGNSYYAAERSLFSVAEDVKWLQEECDGVKSNLRDKLKQLKKNNTLALEDTALVNEVVAMIDNISSTQKKILAIIKDMPAMKVVVEDLYNKYAQEGGGKVRIHGGGDLGNREA